MPDLRPRLFFLNVPTLSLPSRRRLRLDDLDLLGGRVPISMLLFCKVAVGPLL